MGSDYIFKKGFTFKSLLLLAAPLALLNIILELFIKSSKFTFLGVTFINFNTPDPLDLLFGLLALAVAIPVIYLNSEKYTIK